MFCAYSEGPAVAERTLNQAGNTFSQSAPTCHEPPSSAKNRAYASWLARVNFNISGQDTRGNTYPNATLNS
jgi:hypothetical protein